LFVQFPLDSGALPLQCGVVHRHWMSLQTCCAASGAHISIIVPPCALPMMPSGTTSPAAAMMSVRLWPKYQQTA
jgi:hypothetical protein